MFAGYLLISQAQPQDTGQYKCFVSNSVGNDSALATVVVTGEPHQNYTVTSIQLSDDKFTWYDFICKL